MKNRFTTLIDLDENLVKRIKIYCVVHEITFKEFVNNAVIEKSRSLKIYDNGEKLMNKIT